jgi:6,7-dimethyl-8-ribityllumazine synthase
VELEGSLTATGRRFAIVVSRFNPEVTEGLLRGAQAALADAAVPGSDITLVRVPGAFEIPLAAMTLAGTRRFDAVIALGCVIKGDTMHFEYIASAVANGLMQVSTRTGVPVTFGVLTTLTEDQAVERSMDGQGNKGREAAAAAVQMATLLGRIGGETER